jgi:hypothetical protein
MYRHVSYYKLNTRSKCRNPTVRANDTAFLTYSIGARFKYQIRHFCRDLFYSLQVNAPKINGLEIPQSIFFKPRQVQRTHSSYNIIWRSIMSAAYAAWLKISTYLLTHRPTRTCTSLTLYETNIKETYSKYQRLCRNTYPNFNLSPAFTISWRNHHPVTMNMVETCRKNGKSSPAFDLPVSYLLPWPGETKTKMENTIQINQLTRCNNSSSSLLDVYVQLNMFRASSRPSSRAQQLQ